MIRILLGSALVLILAWSAPGADQVSSVTTAPNIVLIVADDMGWSDLGCYGGEIPTPNIDSLAQRGMRFTQFYNNAVCGATRASLLTGLYCQQAGHSGRAWNQPKDFTKCVLIPEVLQESGYHTMMVGKWQGRDLAVRRGFDRFFGPNCQSKISYFHEVHGNDFYLDNQRWRFPAQGFFMTDTFSDYANRFLARAVAQEDPFFLYVAYIAPHWPLHAPQQYIAPHRERYRRRGWDAWRQMRLKRQKEMGLFPDDTQLAPLPRAIGSWEDEQHQPWQTERMAVYSAQIARIDHGVGQILTTLKESGRADNTLILFLSDNGAAPDGGLQPTRRGFGFSDDGAGPAFRRDGVQIRGGSGPDNLPGPAETFAGYGLAWASTSNSPLRNTKSTAYEGGIRTPLIACWPSVIRGGDQITSQPGHVIDLMATCLDVAGVEYPSRFKDRHPLPMEGRSLLPVFQGKQRKEHALLCFSVPRNQAVRMGDWKMVNARRGAPWELYDLGSDPTETNNVAHSHPSRVENMAAAFARWQSRVGDP